MAIKVHKILGGFPYGYLMEESFKDFFRKLFKNQPYAYTTNGGFNAADKFDDLDTPDVTLGTVGVTQFALSWLSVPKAKNYIVAYGTDPQLTNPNYLNTTQTSATVTGLTGGVTYYYQVIASDGISEGVSPIETVNTKLNAPAAFVAGTPAQTTIPLTWTPVVGITYVVERATNSGFTTGLATVGTTTNGFITATGLTASTQYYFRIKATKTNFPDSNYSTTNATTTA